MARHHSGIRPAATPPTPRDPLDGAIGMLPLATFGHAAGLPNHLSGLLRRLDSDITSGDVCRSLVANLPDVPDYFGRALIAVGTAADQSGRSNAYHNPIHSRDVGVIFANLMRMQSFIRGRAPAYDLADFLAGCCAAFGHDVGHDGQDSGPSFRLETIAADRVGAIMDHHTVDPHLIDRAVCAILATDVHNGYRALDAAGRGALSADMPECLHGLANDKTRDAACLLRDADVMQSAGLTADDHDRQTARLEQERGIPAHSMGVSGANFFLKDVIRGRFLSDAGGLFQPQLDHLLALNERRARLGRGAGGLATFED